MFDFLKPAEKTIGMYLKHWFYLVIIISGVFGVAVKNNVVSAFGFYLGEGVKSFVTSMSPFGEEALKGLTGAEDKDIQKAQPLKPGQN
jgi:hypothetical protein